MGRKTCYPPNGEKDLLPTCTMPVVDLQAGQWNWFFLRLATANRPQRSHTCTRYASLWSNSRSWMCITQAPINLKSTSAHDPYINGPPVRREGCTHLVNTAINCPTLPKHQFSLK